jgi:hypothetical protein
LVDSRYCQAADGRSRCDDDRIGDHHVHDLAEQLQPHRRVREVREGVGTKTSDAAPLILGGLLLTGGIIAVFRMVRSPIVLEVVIAMFSLSAIGAAAFLLGRAHAKARREKKD